MIPAQMNALWNTLNKPLITCSLNFDRKGTCSVGARGRLNCLTIYAWRAFCSSASASNAIFQGKLEELYLLCLALMRRKKRPWLVSTTHTHTHNYLLASYWLLCYSTHCSADCQAGAISRHTITCFVTLEVIYTLRGAVPLPPFWAVVVAHT